MRLTATAPRIWSPRLRLPVMVAPMTDVSTPELVIAACAARAAAVFPSHNAPPDLLSERLASIDGALPDGAAPWGVNLIVHASNRRRDADVDALVAHGVEFVVTSVGSPAPVVDRLQNAGCLVLADVASMRHFERALEANVDGLVALCAGAGGQTGRLSPFAFARAIRARFDGPLVLAGGIGDAASVAAACAAGADLAYMGTRFIATEESGATPEYKQALVDADVDDVILETHFTRLPTNVLRTSPSGANRPAPATFEQEALLANRGIWSAGHSVAGADRVRPAGDVVADLGLLVILARPDLFTVC